MGRQKKGNPDAQRNNNKKAHGKKNQTSELGTYAEIEVRKMRND